MQIVSNMKTICTKYQILFSGKNKKNITNLSSAEYAQRVVKITKLLDVWQTVKHSGASDLGLYCLLRPICPNTYSNVEVFETKSHWIVPMKMFTVKCRPWSDMFYSIWSGSVLFAQACLPKNLRVNSIHAVRHCDGIYPKRSDTLSYSS